jgi:hypothetical protein
MLGYPAVEARDALKQWAILKKIVNDSKSNLSLTKTYNFLQEQKENRI